MKKKFDDKCLKMTECNSHETHIYPNLNAIPSNAVPLNDQQLFRLNTINESKKRNAK